MNIKTKREFAKADLGSEDGACCDRCGAVVDRNKIISVYHGPHGEKTDFCPTCFDREVIRKRG